MVTSGNGAGIGIASIAVVDCLISKYLIQEISVCAVVVAGSAEAVVAEWLIETLTVLAIVVSTLVFAFHAVQIKSIRGINMRNRIIVIIIIIVILVFMINPIRYYLADKNLAVIPNHLDYHKAINDSLVSKINSKAASHNCRNIIRPIVRIENQPESLPNLVEDVNLAIASYTKWNLSVDDSMRAKMKQRQEEYIQNWGGIIGGKGIKEILNKKHQINRDIDYFVQASITRIKQGEVDDLELVVKIYNEKLESLVFDIRLNFSDPTTIADLQSKIDQQAAELIELQIKSRNGIYTAGSLGGLLMIFLIVSFIVSYRAKRKEDKERDYHKNQILLRQELIDNGHFVAALELADRYLEYFPNDIEIKAFRERLLDVTNNDPKKAQVAYVEAKKLQLRLENRGQGNYLSIEEKANLTGLLPYHPELENSYTKLIGYEEEDRIKAEFDIKYTELVEIIRLRKWTKAEQEVKLLKNAYPENEQITDVQEEIDQAIKHSEITLKDIKALLGEADIYEIQQKLDELITDHIDNEAALKIKNMLDNSKVKAGIYLESANGIILPVFCKSEVILGREEKGVQVDIAIDSRYISRPHLKMELKQGKLYLEDLNSSGGSYKAGEKIDRTEIANNQTITLAKVIDLNICLQKVDNLVNSVIMECAGKSWAILDKEMKFSIIGNKLDLHHSDNILKMQNELILYSNGNSTDILQDGTMVNINGNEYRVKFI